MFLTIVSISGTSIRTVSAVFFHLCQLLNLRDSYSCSYSARNILSVIFCNSFFKNFSAWVRPAGVFVKKFLFAMFHKKSTSGAAESIIFFISSVFPLRKISSGSLPPVTNANRTSELSRKNGIIIPHARAAAFWPAPSPSKQKIIFLFALHKIAIWSSVSAVPSGATVSPKP